MNADSRRFLQLGRSYSFTSEFLYRVAHDQMFPPDRPPQLGDLRMRWFITSSMMLKVLAVECLLKALAHGCGTFKPIHDLDNLYDLLTDDMRRLIDHHSGMHDLDIASVRDGLAKHRRSFVGMRYMEHGSVDWILIGHLYRAIELTCRDCLELSGPSA